MASRSRNGGSSGGTSTEDRKEPVHTIGPFYTGASTIEVAIWENMVGEGSEERLMYGVSVQRAYKTDDGWKNTKSFRAQDLPHVNVALNEAYLWIQDQQNKQ